MCLIAQMLFADDIENVAEWYSNIGIKITLLFDKVNKPLLKE